MQSQQSDPPLRKAELVAALSIASDLGMGHPMDRALCACIFAVHLGEFMRLDASSLSDIYYTTLLRFVGCAADARHRANYFDDEIALGPQIDAVELWNAESMLPFLEQHVGVGLPPEQRTRKLEWALETGVQSSIEAAVANCEISKSIAVRLSLSSGVVTALGDVFERWDGGGVPGKVKGDELALPARVAQLALDMELFFRIGGLGTMVSVARDRSGGQYDPALVQCLCANRQSLCLAFDERSPWETALLIEPGTRPILTDTGIDEAVRAIADFTDLRTPWMAGHSTAVAQLCEATARELDLGTTEITTLRRAGYVHDVGMVSTSVSVWDRPGTLTESEWDCARLHPYYTERILARSPVLAPLGTLAAMHHERLDGSGYHRQLPSGLLSPLGRILAVAEVYRGMIEMRPHRPRRTPAQAAEELQRLASIGQLDSGVVGVLLEVAGNTLKPIRRQHAANLSDREVEVLRHLAHGLSNKQIAQQLVVSPATIDHHIRHIYNKINVSTRPAATLFAMQHRLLD